MVLADLDEIAVGIPEIDGCHEAHRAGPLDRTEFNRDAACFEMGLKFGDCAVRDQAEVARPGRGNLRCRLEGIPDLVDVNLLLAKDERDRMAGGGNALEPEDALVERAGRLERTDGEDEMIDARDHAGLPGSSLFSDAR